MTRIAFTREVSPSVGECELTHLEREPIDVARARAQHREYERLLERLGCNVVRVPDTPELPDAVFVEDTAIVLPELAVVTRPGAPSRRPEVDSVRDALASHRRLAEIEAPAILDGGDVLVVGRDVVVGRSARSDDAAIGQLERHLAPLGYRVRGVDFRGCLHLKTAVTACAPDLLLVNPAWVDAGTLGPWDAVEVDPAEPFAANALLVGDRLVHPEAFPLTRRILEARGIRVAPVPASELAKAEGGVTCCCLIVED